MNYLFILIIMDMPYKGAEITVPVNKNLLGNPLKLEGSFPIGCGGP